MEKAPLSTKQLISYPKPEYIKKGNNSFKTSISLGLLGTVLGLVNKKNPHSKNYIYDRRTTWKKTNRKRYISCNKCR